MVSFTSCSVFERSRKNGAWQLGSNATQKSFSKKWVQITPKTPTARWTGNDLVNAPRWSAAGKGSFAAFFCIATPDDATWFDMLVLAHVALTRAINVARDTVADPDGLERAC